MKRPGMYGTRSKAFGTLLVWVLVALASWMAGALALSLLFD